MYEYARASARALPCHECTRPIDLAGVGSGPQGLVVGWWIGAPVLLAISYAFPIRKKDGDQIERLQFTFGGAF